MAVVLWHIEVSHYNEKARWALDYKGVAHVRRSLLPGLHVGRVLWMTGQKSVPVLEFDQRTIADSTRIIGALEAAHPEPPLYPANPADRARALALEEFFDEEVGPHIRRVLFSMLLPHTAYAADLVSTGFGTTTRSLYRAVFPALRIAFRYDMGIEERRVERSRERIAAGLDRLEAERQPSGYLVGEHFSVADLTAAALLFPLVWPREVPYALPEPLPEPAASYRASLASRPAFAWVEEMYRRHRGHSAEVAA